MPERHQVECMDGTATMVIDDDGAVTFEGWDREAEAAWIAIGGEPSPCWIVVRAIEEGKLDEELLERAAEEDTQLVEVLIAAGADVNAKDNNGMTPLHFAVCNEHTDTAVLLLENGAGVNAKTNSGSTPLHWAAWKGYTNTAALLLENGTDVNAKEDADWTPLHFAARNGHTDTAVLLLENGAGVNAKTNFGSTPLHLAKACGCADAVAFLENWIKEHP